eukprot:6503409-Pyramimonas_sp.AAC.1
MQIEVITGGSFEPGFLCFFARGTRRLAPWEALALGSSDQRSGQHGARRNALGTPGFAKNNQCGSLLRLA